MRVAVYGVTNWDDEQQAQKLAPTLIEWEQRVRAFIPQCTELFLTTGSYSPPEFSPIDIPIYQAEMYRGVQYDIRNSYFRFGLMTGIWKKILDNDFDILIHCQCTRFIAKSIENEINEFIGREERIMAPRFSSLIGTSIDVGFIAMKKTAALYYAGAGHRPCFDQGSHFPLNCEDEAYLLFATSWFNPWPEMISTKQLDNAHGQNDYNAERESPFFITDKNKFSLLPIIANGKHVTDEFLQAWMEANPLPT